MSKAEDRHDSWPDLYPCLPCETIRDELTEAAQALGFDPDGLTDSETLGAIRELAEIVPELVKACEMSLVIVRANLKVFEEFHPDASETHRRLRGCVEASEAAIAKVRRLVDA